MIKTIKIINIGSSSLDGQIYKEYEEAKACNFCKHFQGYGLHWCAGKCILKDKEIEGGYVGGYSKAAKECDSFDCKLELLGKLEINN